MLRSGADHVNLKIETGRHVRPKIPSDQRVCKLCTLNIVEDEIHFLIQCPVYQDIRDKYNISISCISNNEDLFVSLLNTNSTENIFNVTKYLNEAFEKRKELMNDILV